MDGSVPTMVDLQIARDAVGRVALTVAVTGQRLRLDAIVAAARIAMLTDQVAGRAVWSAVGPLLDGRGE